MASCEGTKPQHKALSNPLEIQCLLCFRLKTHLIYPVNSLIALPLVGRIHTTVNTLVSSGIQLIFFLVTSTVLCFGFRVRILLVTHWCVSGRWAMLTRVKDFSDSHAALQEPGGAQGAEEGHNWDNWPQLLKGIFPTIGCHAQDISWGERWLWGCCLGTGWAGVSWWWAIVSDLHYLFFLGFISLYFCHFPFHYNIYFILLFYFLF